MVSVGLIPMQKPAMFRTVFTSIIPRSVSCFGEDLVSLFLGLLVNVFYLQIPIQIPT